MVSGTNLQLQNTQTFDLEFLRPAGVPSDVAGWKAWFSSREHFRISDADDGSVSIRYRNAETGVNFELERDIEDAATWPDDWPLIPEGYAPTGLSFSLSCFQPSFFGLEAVPVVAEFAEAFGLMIFDLQEEGPRFLGHFTADEILNRWNIRNQQVIDDARKLDAALTWMSRPKAISLWDYMRRRSNLLQQLAAIKSAIAVRSILLLRRGHETECQRVIAWTVDTPTILPDVDLVVCVARPAYVHQTTTTSSFLVNASALQEWLATQPGNALTYEGMTVLPALTESEMDQLDSTLQGERDDDFEYVGEFVDG